jgi:antitoxin component YwqK of YwqJK toxin-antitoxin module
MKKTIHSLLAILLFASFYAVQAQVPGTVTNLPDTVNRTDDKGNKTGFWIEKLGDKTFKGDYADNVRIKCWVGYYANDAIYALEYYDKGLKDGISIQLDRKGKISLVEHYRNGQLSGKKILYSQYSDRPVAESEYLQGKKNGVHRQFYETGKVQEETWYKDDLKHGSSVWNDKNGKKLVEYWYKEGNFDGVQKTYYDNDSLQTVTNYLNNNLSGESREYYRNGKLKLSGKYVDGKKEGVWTEYDELGKISKTIKYKDGVETVKK